MRIRAMSLRREKEDKSGSAVGSGNHRPADHYFSDLLDAGVFCKVSGGNPFSGSDTMAKRVPL